ncbi:hypothetical protein GCM10011505_13550 [Tistrella bauzanensis]|uniref:GGDEF-domain containing protein n=1 Tax=Tistrella bauzanensis TaxID=657419 RepID=A0ABQ1IC14_9PROT|nr:EAL domain-containing protein [Tistrella bauzanensis]GGB33346.1 hypothetical protein GCM10011505_13550 [Tistrella bauzanensis]
MQPISFMRRRLAGLRYRLATRDIGAILVTMAVATYVVVAIDLYEDSLTADSATAMIELDEALSLGVLLSVLLLGFTLRQYRLQKREMARRIAAERQARELAYQDPLTGLANRRQFEEALTTAIASPPRAGAAHALLLLDLNGFKQINDVHGHGIGDEVLIILAARLLGAVRDGDLVARLGGDEFAVLSQHLAGPEAATGLARRLMRVCDEPVTTGRVRHTIGTGIGIALLPQDATDPGEALRRADIALYRAKAERRSAYRFFEAEMDQQIRLREALERDLRAALDAGLLHLRFRPCFDLRSGAITGFDAIPGWHHPVHGDLPPDRFVPIAEDTGLIHALGRWMLTEACEAAQAWPGHVSLAVDIFPGQLRDAGLPAQVAAILNDSGLSPDRLELDITESALVGDPQAAGTLCAGLRRLGVRVALDNFGTGYSSLYHLRHIKLDRVKIDRSFIEQIGDSETSRIVSALAGLGDGLGMDVSAEGMVGGTDGRAALLRHGIHTASNGAALLDQAESLLLARRAAALNGTEPAPY